MLTRTAQPLLGLALLLLLAACPGPKSPVTVRVLDFDQGTQLWAYRDEQLDTVEDLNTLKGSRFELLGNQLVAKDALAKSPPQDPAQASPAILRDRILARRGDAVSPSYDFTTVDGQQVAVANDFESLAMFTIFRHFEKVWGYYQDVVKDESGATQLDTLVGFYATMGVTIGISAPLMVYDNAAFVPESDSFITLRILMLDGIPLAMNSGVIAHEFSHRVFHHNVFAGPAFANWYQNLILAAPTGDATDTAGLALQRTFVLLKALDEGCADINGVGYLQRTDFIADSMVSAPEEKKRRDVDGEFAKWVTYGGLSLYDPDTDTTAPTEAQGCGAAKSFTDMTFSYYCLGTAWARALWVGADADTAVLRSEVLPALNKALNGLGTQLATRWSFDFNLIIDLLVQQAPAARKAPLCTALRDKFADVMGQVTACP